MTGNSGLYPPAEDPVNEERTGLIKNVAVIPFHLLDRQLPYDVKEVGVARTTPHETVDDIGWRCTVLHHIRVGVVLLRQHARVGQNNRIHGAHTLHVKVSIQPPVGVQHKVPCTNRHSMSRSANNPRGCTTQSTLYKQTLHVMVCIQPPVGVQHKVPRTNTHSMSRSAFSPLWVYTTKYLVQTHTSCQGQHTAPCGCTTQSTLYKHTLHVKVSIQPPVGVHHKVPCTNTHFMSRSAYSPSPSVR